ncbi:6-hydroxymethylpterin diphosphokinase MptE-like protein [uncultured Clostridium sp.]|uniref:motility associated factor glycosyltransferase family protein n=1 Tax=uncultured Clostridium sp. TaxID=59620 RepID=UPI0028EF7BBD|nr:6-hydroxymethylpterin diphosphokinase MptE-like protein [uncultured Clostridium sp.]
MSLNIDKSRDGYNIVQVNIDGKKQYIGSKYNQKREIENFVKEFKNCTINDNYIVFGLSLGEHIVELLNKISDKSQILIVEINDELVEYYKSYDNTKNIFKNPRIELAQNADEVKSFFRKYITQVNINNLEIEYYARYEKLYIGKLNDIYETIKNESQRIISDKNTSLYFGINWFNSLLDNLKYMATGTVVNNLKDKYKNIPAIIVSAGPSLQKNVDELKGIENSLILTGGRTLGTLVERKIEPTCLCVVDPGGVSYKLVENHIDKVTCPLVFYEGTNSKVIENHNGKKIFSANNKFLSDVWKEEIQSLSGGGSVAHAMTILAAYMGCNPVVFIGQDLAYTGEKGHAICSGNKWKKLTFDDYKRSDDLYVEDINGELVRTSIVLNSYRLAMEEVIEAFPNTQFINATEGGVNIKGTENKTLKDTINNFKENHISELEIFLKADDKTQDVINGLKKNIKLLEQDISLCDKGEHVLDDFKINYYLKKQSRINKNLKDLDDIDHKLRNNINDINIINSILFNTIYEIENNDEFIINMSDNKEVAFKKNINKNRAIYCGLKKVMKICCEKLKLAVKELED